MTIWATTRIFVIGAILIAPVTVAHAVMVDFTSNTWSGVDGINSHSIGTGITLSSVGGNMTLNSSDGAFGCGNPNKLNIISTTGLDCSGDGIGIGDDEILQGGNQGLTGLDDGFNDYALARIEVSAVPIPSAFWMFGTALLGFVAIARRI
jgi:hypothetical protein